MGFTTGMKYTHYVPPAPPNLNYPSQYKFILVESIDHLKSIISSHQQCEAMAYDCETSGLNPDTDFIVGYSFSYGNKTSYYVPIKHMDTTNCLPSKEALDIIYEEMCRKKWVLFFNYRFDIRFLQFEGYDITKIKYWDAAQAVFHSDSNDKYPGLKRSVFHFLGIKMVTFEDVTDGKYNFYMTDPKESYGYAAGDAICTFELSNRVFQYYTEAGLAGKNDNNTLLPILFVENHKTKIDIPMLQKYATDVEVVLQELEKSIYEDFGRVFKIGSPKQLSDVLKDSGIYTGQDTKTGYMKTGMKELKPLLGKYPYLKHLIEYKEYSKLMSSYIEPLRVQATDKGGYLRFGYKTTGTPTGRTASGKEKKNKFFAELAVTAISKSEAINYFCKKVDDGVKWDKARNILMGWEFARLIDVVSGDDKKGFTLKCTSCGHVWKEPHKVLNCPGCHKSEISDMMAESQNQDLNIRSTFIPEADEAWVSIDFAAQELRIAANLSKEPVWTTAFLSGEDPHKSTAYSIWGKENYTKDFRKLAKIMNFCVLYGGGASTIAMRGDLPMDKAKEFYELFRQGLPTLFGFIEAITNKAKQTGVVYNYFGRPRRVKFYLENSDKKLRAFGARTVVNTSVQSAAADIFKIALLRVWSKYGHGTKYDGIVNIKSMIYDELNFTVKYDYIEEVVPGLVECMAIKVPGWDIPMEVSVSFGQKWGNCFEFNYDANTKVWTPKMEKFVLKENKPTENILVSDEVLKEYESLLDDEKFKDLYEDLRGRDDWDSDN